MFSWFDSIRFRRPTFLSFVANQLMRVMFGLIFVYVGVNLAGALVKNDSNANEKLKMMVQKYDAVDILSSIATDVVNAVSNSFSKNGQPTSLIAVNKQTKEVSASLEESFKEKIPLLRSAFNDIADAIIKPIKDAIKQGGFKK